mmetsp:Transcript_1972/g.7695  ORF Transcript_1972/g.7695 Transcript_1972/m.7695 type:complete len:204 (-) Transcript_1972:1521-2132(-)
MLRSLFLRYRRFFDGRYFSPARTEMRHSGSPRAIEDSSVTVADLASKPENHTSTSREQHVVAVKNSMSRFLKNSRYVHVLVTNSPSSRLQAPGAKSFVTLPTIDAIVAIGSLESMSAPRTSPPFMVCAVRSAPACVRIKSIVASSLPRYGRVHSYTAHARAAVFACVVSTASRVNDPSAVSASKISLARALIDCAMDSSRPLS